MAHLLAKMLTKGLTTYEDGNLGNFFLDAIRFLPNHVSYDY